MSEDKTKRITTKYLKTEIENLRNEIRTPKLKLGIETISTIIIAFTTTIYCITTIGILLQMQRDNRLQREYYQKTVRPFVYAHTISLDSAEEPFTKDSKVKIKYSLENVGTLPAMDLHHKILYEEQVNEGFKQLDISKIKWKEDKKWTSSGLYPNEKYFGFPYSLREQITIGELQKQKWAHIIVTYKDAGGKSYFYKWIVELRLTVDESKLILDPINKWSDFN